MIKISPKEFQVFSRYIHGLCGVNLDETKAYLIETRLNDLLNEFDCTSYSEFYYRAKSDFTYSLNKKIIDAITTPETLFFRDSYPFELLKHKFLPELIQKKQSKSAFSSSLRIWSAASSTGQEIYSIAMVLKEVIPDFQKLKITLLATDISDATLASARAGKYNQFQIARGLSKERLKKYFIFDNASWNLKDEIKNKVTFQKINLMKPFNIGKFDIIFCRNVSIYFNLEDRTKLFNKIADCLEPHGYLIIGSSEFLTGICSKFKAFRHSKSIYYQLEQ